MTVRRMLAALGALPVACTAPAPAARQRAADHSAPAEDQTSGGGDTAGSSRAYPLDAPPDSSTTTEPTTSTTLLVTIAGMPATTVGHSTTTTIKVDVAEDQSDDEWWAAQPGYKPGQCGGDLPPCWVMRRESGGDPRAVNATGCGGRGCFGKWQFDPLTWAGYAGVSRASDVPEWVQDERARQIWAGGRGCSHWGAC